MQNPKTTALKLERLVENIMAARLMLFYIMSTILPCKRRNECQGKAPLKLII